MGYTLLKWTNVIYKIISIIRGGGLLLENG